MLVILKGFYGCYVFIYCAGNSISFFSPSHFCILLYFIIITAHAKIFSELVDLPSGFVYLKALSSSAVPFSDDFCLIYSTIKLCPLVK